MNKKSKLIYYS